MKTLHRRWVQVGRRGLGCAVISIFWLGTLLCAGTAASAGDAIYVPMGSGDKIIVLDPNSDSIVAEISGTPAVHGLAGTSDSRYLIAGSFHERETDGGAPAKPAGVPEDEHAAHHQMPPVDAGKAAAAVSTVTVIKTADGSIVRRIDVPGAVHHVAVSPDNEFALVTHPGEGTVTAVDLVTFAVAATVETGALPNYAVFSPDGSRAFVSNGGSNTISEIDTASWTVSRMILTGAAPEHIALSRDGARLYVNNVDDGMVSMINTEMGLVERTYAVGTNLHGIDMSDDGRILYVASRGDDKLVAIDLEDGGMRSVALVPEPYHLATIRGAGKIYVSSADQPKIWVVDQNSLAVLGEIPIGGKGHQIVQGVSG